VEALHHHADAQAHRHYRGFGVWPQHTPADSHPARAPAASPAISRTPAPNLPVPRRARRALGCWRAETWFGISPLPAQASRTSGPASSSS